MTFVRFSITFKILVVGILLATIYEIGLVIEGESEGLPAVLFGWFNQTMTTIPFTPGNTDSLIFALTNSFYFYGSFICLIVIQFFVGKGIFVRTDWKAIVVVILLVTFSASTVLHYADMFLNQEHNYYFERENVFGTTKSKWAFNAYDNFIAIAILVQIAQALLNTGLKRLPKRQVTA